MALRNVLVGDHVTGLFDSTGAAVKVAIPGVTVGNQPSAVVGLSAAGWFQFNTAWTGTQTSFPYLYFPPAVLKYDFLNATKFFFACRFKATQWTDWTQAMPMFTFANGLDGGLDSKQWTPIVNTEYYLEMCWDIVAKQFTLRVNGAQQLTAALSGFVPNIATNFSIGANSAGSSVSVPRQFAIRDALLYDNIDNGDGVKDWMGSVRAVPLPQTITASDWTINGTGTIQSVVNDTKLPATYPVPATPTAESKDTLTAVNVVVSSIPAAIPDGIPILWKETRVCGSQLVGGAAHFTPSDTNGTNTVAGADLALKSTTQDSSLQTRAFKAPDGSAWSKTNLLANTLVLQPAAG